MISILIWSYNILELRIWLKYDMKYGTLFFFNSSTSKSEPLTTGVLNSTWNTTYYNSEGRKVGTSTSKPLNPSANPTHNTTWNTTYYNSEGRKVGTSRSEPFTTGLRYPTWNTTYYNSEGRKVGTSRSEPLNPSVNFTYSTTYNTTYCNSEGRRVGTSRSEPLTTGVMNPTWNTSYTYSAPKQTVRARASASKQAAPAPTPLQVSNQPDPKITHLKVYYVSEAGTFNASASIFTRNNTREEQVVKVLKARAQRNPGGASYKTLKSFFPELVEELPCEDSSEQGPSPSRSYCWLRCK